MVRPRWKKLIRDGLLHRSRTVLVILAIAIGIVGAGSVLDTWATLRRITREGYAATNPPSATLRTDSVDAALLARVRAISGIGAAAGRRTVLANVLVNGAWRAAALYALDDFRGTIGKIEPVSGDWPPKEGSVVVEKSSLEMAAAGPGGSLTFQLGTGAPITLAIGGVARDAGLAPGWMEHVVYAFVTSATMARLGVSDRFNQLQIVVADRGLDREAVRKLAFRVKAVVEATGRAVADVDVPEPGRHIHAAQIGSLLFIEGAFGALALLLSGFLVVNLIAAMLTGQVREIGIMKTLGATTGSIAAMYLVLALVFGVIATAVAIPVGATIARWYIEFMAEMLNFPTEGIGIPGWAIAVQVAVGLILPVMAAAVPVYRGCSITVNEALSDLGIDSRPRQSTPMLGVTGLGRPILLSLRNAFRRRGRMATTLITLATGGAVYLGALNLRTAIRASVSEMFEDTNRFDLVFRFSQSYPADSLEAIVRALPGVAAAEGWSGRRAAVSRTGDVVGNAFVITGLPATSTMVQYPMLEGRWLTADDDHALVVNRSFLAEEPSLQVGDELTLVLAGQASRWTIVGAVQGMPQASGYATRNALALATGQPRVGTVVVKAADSTPDGIAAVSRRLRTDLESRGLHVDSSQLMAESRLAFEDHLLLVASFLMAMAQLVVIVGGLGLASTMSLAVLERTREIGVLRAIGARHGAIFSMVQIEALTIGILSWLLAIPLSIPISVLLGKGFGRIMISVPTRYLPDGSGVGWWLALVLLVSVAASAWPASKATRVPVAKALAYQ